MVETEFNFWVPGSILCHRERISRPGSDDTSPLLVPDLGHGDLSPSSRLRRIEEGRKELMEMIRDVPESCYELSLKDMVVDPRPCMEDLATEADDKHGKNKKRRKRMRILKDSSVRPGRVTRSSSVEAGSFLIRMFLPAFLTPNKKQQPMSGNGSRTPLSSPRLSVDRSDGRWRLTRDDGRRSHEGTSRSRSCTSRVEHGGRGFLAGFWPFGGSNNSIGKVMKGKMTRQKTCIF